MVKVKRQKGDILLKILVELGSLIVELLLEVSGTQPLRRFDKSSRFGSNKIKIPPVKIKAPDIYNEY